MQFRRLLPQFIPLAIIWLSLLIIVGFVYRYRTQLHQPVSSQALFHQSLLQALAQSQLSYQNLSYDPVFYQVNFQIPSHDSTTSVTLSTQKDPYLQIVSLQQILKIAKIKGKDALHIDLSQHHPYATLQNRQRY
jgi:hypothetical protein